MVDVPGDLTTNATIAVGTPITGAIETVGDDDWYKVNLTAGQKVTIAVNLGTLEDSYLYLRNASGGVIAENDDGGGGRGSRLVFTAPTTGTYYIDVSAWVNDGSDPDYTATGSYTLSVSNYVMPGVGTLDEIAYQMTHGFHGGDFHHFDVTQGGTITVDLTGITPNGRTVALQALQQWTDIIGVNFVEQSGNAQITFDDLDQGTGAFADTVHENHITTSAIVNVATYRINLHTYMHEIGHALGLGHTSNSNAGTAASVYPDDALWSNDGAAVSIMSYFDNGENGYYANLGFSNVAIKTPQVADIIAMGNLYGLSTTTRIGDTTYGFNNNSGRTAFDAVLNPNVAYTIFDSGGVDTLDYSGFASNQLINLNPETFSNIGSSVGNVVIARGVVIENAIGGGGTDTIIGNAAANVLRGNVGNDTLTGGAGKDTFLDTVSGHNGDTITDFSPGDKIVLTDATLAGFTFSLSGNTLTYSGGSLTLNNQVSAPIVASAAASGGVQLSLHVPEFSQTVFSLAAFGAAQGWSSNNITPRMLADIGGDGRADIVGFGNDGVYVSLANASDSFAAPVLATTAFGAAAGAGGWTTNDLYPRQVADVDGDHRADIIGFGNDGVYVSFGQADGSFAAPHAATTAFGAGASAGGWSSNDKYPRIAADVNGDGKTDIIGFGNDGVYVSLGQSDGSFANPNAATTAFGYANYAGGWSSNDLYPREVADLNNDDRADIVGFGNNGVYVSLGQADGTFANPIVGLTQFGAAAPGGSWTSQTTFPRELADVNGDHKVDIVGFGNDGVYIALGNGDGTFQPSMLDVGFFGASDAAGSWNSQDTYPRLLADVNHDGAADIVGFAGSGVYVAYSNGDIFA